MPKGRFGNRSMTSWDNISSASRTEISSYKGQYKVHHFLHSSLFWARSENKHHNISRVFCNQLEEWSTLQHNRKTMRTLPLESTASPCLQTRHKSTLIWATVLILRSDKPTSWNRPHFPSYPHMARYWVLHWHNYLLIPRILSALIWLLWTFLAVCRCLKEGIRPDENKHKK